MKKKMRKYSGQHINIKSDNRTMEYSLDVWLTLCPAFSALWHSDTAEKPYFPKRLSHSLELKPQSTIARFYNMQGKCLPNTP